MYYIRVNQSNEVVWVFRPGAGIPQANDIEIEGDYLPPHINLTTEDGIYTLLYVNNQFVERTAEEIATIRASRSPVPTLETRLSAVERYLLSL